MFVLKNNYFACKQLIILLTLLFFCTGMATVTEEKQVVLVPDVSITSFMFTLTSEKYS